MSETTKQNIEGLINLTIVVNKQVDQKHREYAFKKHRARPLTQSDSSSLLEFCSYPWPQVDGEWACLAQWNDEDVMLVVNPYNIMKSHQFYRDHMMDIASTNHYARSFVKDYMDFLASNDPSCSNNFEDKLLIHYLRRLLDSVVDSIARTKRNGPHVVDYEGKLERASSVFIPLSLWKSSIQFWIWRFWCRSDGYLQNGT
eukprot:160476_1